MIKNNEKVAYGESEIKTTAQAYLPAGYSLVTEGQSQAGDLPFYGNCLMWSEVPIAETETGYINLPVEEFWALARPTI